MALYNADFFKNGREVYNRNFNGTCTGVFQGAGYGSFPRDVDFDTVTVEISSKKELSDQFLKKVTETKLMQALVPGLEMLESNPYGDNKKVNYKFPHVDQLPSDQIICAMRILNAWGGGYYMANVKMLREYELTTSEMLVIAMFGNQHPVSSDSVPSLWHLTKAHALMPAFERLDRILKMQTWQREKKQPYASMLLPLIRGEIQAGWQFDLRKGYMKEDAVIYVLAGNPYNAQPWWDLCPDTANLTVNHPLIHPSTEGPRLGGSLIEVTEWVLTQLGK